MWILQSATDPDGDSWTFRMAPGAIKTLGRAPRADFVVEAALVSRLHCRLTASDTHQSVDYHPITRYEVVGGYLNLDALIKEQP